MSDKVVFLNPSTCGIYKSGGTRYKIDPTTGKRTDEIDNEMLEHVEAYRRGEAPPGFSEQDAEFVFDRRVIAPTYYDPRYDEEITQLLKTHKLKPVTIGGLLEEGIIEERRGHGSPGNDQRKGIIPYIKVSDIRGLRVNINPTNLCPVPVAHRLWRGSESGLQGWDLISPNRASSNIGEFAILLPGEEHVVLTKEMFIFRVANDSLIDPFYLLWALLLRPVREQWRRIALMQTNREDCGDRYREIVIPRPPSKKWAMDVSKPFRDYFTTLAEAKHDFRTAIEKGQFTYIPGVMSDVIAGAEDDSDE